MLFKNCAGGCKNMSDNKENSHSHDEDQKYIESLYDDLDKPACPSDLDDKIHAAAHQAVALPVSSINKRPSWAKPLSAAAMVMLVASVSLHQIMDPSAPLDAQSYGAESMVLDDAGSQFSMEYKSKEKAKKKREVAAKSSAKKKVQSPAKRMPQRSLASEPITATDMSMAQEQAMALSAETVAEKSVVDDVIEPKVLTLGRFRRLEKGRWLYQQQDAQYYWLWYQHKKKTQYRLEKSVFSLFDYDALYPGASVQVQIKQAHQ